MTDKNIYYDISKLLTYNRFLNIVIGHRGGGKTYQAKKLAIRNFINKGEEFIYLRRYKSDIELKGKMENFFEDIKEEFPGHEFKIENGKFFIDKKLCGYFMALSKATNYKSTPFPRVTTIIFDEFIIDKGFIHYIPNEVFNFFEFISTVVRKRSNVRVIMLSNAISINNPYFTYFDIDYRKGARFQKYGKQIVIEYYTNENYAKEFYDTPFGELIKGSKYGDYAIGNTFARDNSNFIKKKTGNCTIFFNIMIHNKTYGVWEDLVNKCFFVSNDYEKNYPVNFSFLDNEHSEKYEKLTTRNYRYIMFKRMYIKGNVYFETIKIKNALMEILKG